MKSHFHPGLSRFFVLAVAALSILIPFQSVTGTSLPATPALDQFVEKWLGDSKVSGVSIGLIKEGALVVAKGYGLANRETQLKAAADTVWSKASCSKPVVALAALKLVEQGKLDLDRDVSDYLGFTLRNSNFPGEKITMRQILAHSASLKDASPADINRDPSSNPPQQLEQDIRSWLVPGGSGFADGAFWDPSAVPGTQYAYANVGSTLAGLVIEKASGQSFNVFCNQQLFSPMGLGSTRWFFAELPDPAKVAVPYDETFQPYGHYEFAQYPSGQLRTSVLEFSQILLMLIHQGEWKGQRILSAASVAEMLRVQFPDVDPEGGLHVGVAPSDSGETQFYHQGEENGVGAYFFYQGNKSAALFMANARLKEDAYDSLMNRLLEEIPNLPAGTPSPTPTPEPTPTPTPTPTPSPGTPLLADNGFRPSANGFRFENYGSVPGVINLTPDELQRMFGDRVFATLTPAQKILTPAAQKWMEVTSGEMNGGHCEGMAVLSLLVYSKQIQASLFGSPNLSELSLEGNPLLQREIAYWWATQVVDPTRSSEIFGTPTEVLDKLIEGLKPGSTETYTLGVRQEGKGGHAVTPYAVEDQGGGIVHVLVYDNNHPNVERRLKVDRNKNTWELNLSTNPAEAESVWAGDAATRSFSLSPSSPRLTMQVSPFLEETPGEIGLMGRRSTAPKFNEIWVDGDGVKILISDTQGNRYGYEAGKFHREIPGVIHHMLKSGDELWKDSPSPTYYVPVGLAFTITLDGSVVEKETESSVTMIGPGYELTVDDIRLDPNQKDTIVFSPDGTSLSYKTASNESPEISIGFETPGADYDFTIQGVDVEADSTLTIRLDRAKNTLSIHIAGNDEIGAYALSMGRFDQDNAQYFDQDEIELGPNDTATLDYGNWPGNKATMPLLIDYDSDGTVDEVVQLIDEDKIGGALPELTARPASGGGITVSWPASAADYVLEANSALSSSGWTAVPSNQVGTEGGNRVFADSVSGAARFFRLRRN